jgi:DNA-binding MarR family transcriptional regulator
VADDKVASVDTAAALNSGAIHLLRALRRVDKAAGLTPARLSALSVLVFGGPCTLGRLADIEEVAGPTMTRIVDGLSELGLAQRSTHPHSGRAVLISATPSGSELMHAAADRRHQAIVASMAELSALDQAALHRAAPALVRLAEALRNTGGLRHTDPPAGPGRRPRR